jgi:hypothetical protein
MTIMIRVRSKIRWTDNDDSSCRNTSSERDVSDIQSNVLQQTPLTIERQYKDDEDEDDNESIVS